MAVSQFGIYMLVLISVKLHQFDCQINAEVLPGCDGKVDLVFILDSSLSVLDSDPIGQYGYTWSSIRNFTRGVVQHLPVGTDTRIAAIRYGTKAEVVFHLAQHHSHVTTEDALLAMPHMGGNTNTAAALRLARTQVFNGDYGARGDARDVVVYVGDGIHNVEAELTSNEIRYVKDAHAEIYTVGISAQILQDELEKMASSPKDEHFLHAMRLDDLDIVKLFLAHRICRLPDPEITTSKTPECTLPNCKICDETTCFVCKDGMFLDDAQCKDCVPNCKICTNQHICEQCMAGWFWDPIIKRCAECDVIADLALVVDNSGSIRDKNPDDNSYDNYQLLKDFINRLLDRIDVGANATRVGAIKFSSQSQLVFHLDKYDYRPLIQEAISDMGFGGGHTNISGGLRMMRTKLFNEDQGDRDDVGNIAIIITDGESTIDKNLTTIEANLAKAAGITLFVVGITDEINEQELKTIASPPIDDHYFNSTDIRNLDELLDGLIKQVCMPRYHTTVSSISLDGKN